MSPVGSVDWAAMQNEESRAANEPTFDQRLERLETLVAELEDKKLGLEPAIARYQEGIELLKGCHSQLQGFRARVEELTRDAEGGLRPFAEDPDAPGAAAR